MRKLKNEELERLNVEDFKEAVKHPLVLVLDNVRSMHNVGSAFRTADAFLLEKIYLCGITATPPHREIHKTALGSTDTVNWEYYKSTEEAIHRLKAEAYQILVLEQADFSTELQHFKPLPNDRYAVVFGNEIKGVGEQIVQMADKVIEIPQFGTKHSFNISVSIGIAVWELCRKMGFII